MRKFLLCAVAPLFCLVLLAQDPGPGLPAGQPPPSGITLLPGYQHQLTRGRDSVDGRIWKDQGLDIHYNYGLGAGDRVDSNGLNLQWSKRIESGGTGIKVAMTKDRVLLVTFRPDPDVKTRVPLGPTNFYATVKSDEDIADMLLMVLSYKR